MNLALTVIFELESCPFSGGGRIFAMILLRRLLLVGVLWAFPSWGAGISFDVSIDTAAINGSTGMMAFDLIDGDVLQNSQLSVTNFSTDAVLGSISTFGGPVIGSLPGAVTIADGAFFNELLQDITFGTSISFTFMLATTSGSDPFPDAFSFFLLDSFGVPLFSTNDVSDPALSSGVLFQIDGPGTAAALTVFEATTVPPGAPEGQFVTWSVTPVPVPEPTGFELLALALLVLGGLNGRRVWRRMRLG
jgi:hypothetical protein